MDYYGTLGPSCNDENILSKMIDEGMTGIRLNLSHGDLEDNKEYIEKLRKAENITGKKMKLLIDLKGPELRTGTLKALINISEGEKIIIGEGGVIDVPSIIFGSINNNQQILIDDGKILIQVESFDEKSALCVVLRGGTLKSSKSMAFPEANINPPTLTDSDRLNISKALEYGVTGVMLPFVRNKQDLICLRDELLKSNCENIEILAKIENKSGIEKLDELMDFADSFVIARGDLGNSMDLWELPKAQKVIAEKCKKYNKPFMIVTQMLDSMHTKKVPTRAEVLDIFNAVVDGASSIMLTGETAAGNYPVESMRYLVKTGEEALKYINK